MKYFNLQEFLVSQTASRKNIKEQYTPPKEVIENLNKLVDKILDPLRISLGPIKVSSGYRCPKLNEAVGGAKSSQHLTGEAADIQGLDSISNADIFKKIQTLKLPFDQLIWEYGDKNEPNWVHVSFGPRNRRQVLYVGI